MSISSTATLLLVPTATLLMVPPTGVNSDDQVFTAASMDLHVEISDAELLALMDLEPDQHLTIHGEVTSGGQARSDGEIYALRNYNTILLEGTDLPGFFGPLVARELPLPKLLIGSCASP